MGFKVDESKVRILKRLQDKISNIPYPHASLIGEELVISLERKTWKRTLSVSVPDEDVHVNGSTWLNVVSRYLDKETGFSSADRGRMTTEEIFETVRMLVIGWIINDGEAA